MTRPNFTPDPPPEGADSAELTAWFMDQLNRIADWWPPDYDARLAALETRNTVNAGTFPLNTRVAIGITVTDVPALNCGEGSVAEIASTPFYNPIGIMYANTADRVVLFSTNVVTTPSRIVEVNPNTGAVTDLHNVTGEVIYGVVCSPTGSISTADRVIWMEGGFGSTIYFKCYTLAPWTMVWEVSLSYGGSFSGIAGESNSSILVKGSLGMRYVNKATGGNSADITPDAGYSLPSNFHAAYLLPHAYDWQFIIKETATNDYHVVEVPNGHSSIGASDIVETLSVGSATDLVYGGAPVVDSDGNVYWPIISPQMQAAEGESHSTFILRVNASKVHDRTWGFSTTGISSFGATNLGVLTYQEDRDVILCCTSNKVQQYHIPTNTWSECTPSGVDDNIFGAAYVGNDTLWTQKTSDTNNVGAWEFTIY